MDWLGHDGGGCHYGGLRSAIVSIACSGASERTEGDNECAIPFAGLSLIKWKLAV